MSHAQTWKLRAAACLHVSRSKFTWMHTANAATASEKRSVREPGGMANCVGFLLCQIRRMPRQLNTTLLCSYGGIGRRGRFRFCWATPVQVQILLAALFFCFCQRLRAAEHICVGQKSRASIFSIPGFLQCPVLLYGRCRHVLF